MDSAEYPVFNDVFRALKRSLDDGAIRVLTIALSLSHTGGNQMAKTICEKACEILEIDPVLP